MWQKSQMYTKLGKRLTQAVISPLEVKIEGTTKEAFEDGFKKFKALVQRERIVGQVKERMAYEKPSAKKRRKSREFQERKKFNDIREKLVANGEWDKRQKRKERKRHHRNTSENREEFDE